jgi:hypothetical protein
VNLDGLCGCPAVRQCAALRQCEAVCRSAHGSMHAVHAAECGSALGAVWQRVWQCGNVPQCAAVRAAGCGSV